MASSSHQSGLKVATEGMSEEEIAAAIEMSRVQGWSELKDGGQDGAAISSQADTDAAIWEELKRNYPGVFWDLCEGELQLGRVIAEGGQATIYEARWGADSSDICNRWVAKVFKMEGFSLRDLQHQWPRNNKIPRKLSEFHSIFPFQMGGVVFGEFMRSCSYVWLGTLLEDGRFAFVMRRHWGDLRSLINHKVNANHSQGPPFSLKRSTSIMCNIGRGMRELHARGVVHRDLKAANILVSMITDPKNDDFFTCKVADYESSMLVQGTGFWRAPEVLEDLQKQPSGRDASIWTEKVDIYSYAMTCYEVLTGQVPFHGCTKSHWKKVIDGDRPCFPDYVDPRLQKLVEKCWHKDPTKRPTFEAIVYELKVIRSKAGVLGRARHASSYVFQKMWYKVDRLSKCSRSG